MQRFRISWVIACASVACVDTEAVPLAREAALDAGSLDAAVGPLKPPSAPTRERVSTTAAAQPPATLPSAAGMGGTGPAGRQPSAAGTVAADVPLAAASDAAVPAQPALGAPSRAGEIVISELMIDPKTLSDSEGEWIELYDSAAEPFDLRGCELDDGGKSPHAIDMPLRVEAHGYVTLARQSNPGFTPSYVLPLSLTNSADTVALRCAGREIDRVRYDKSAGYPLVSGASLALDPAHLDATADDQAAFWCAAQTSYGPELGTPGRANPSCDGDSDAGAEPALE